MDSIFHTAYNEDSRSTSYNSTATGNLKVKISKEPIKLKIKFNKDIKQEYAIEQPSPSAHIAANFQVSPNGNILEKSESPEIKKKKVGFFKLI